MTETTKLSTKTYKALFIAVSIVLVAVLFIQCLFWAGALGKKEEQNAAKTKSNTYSLSHDGYTLEQVVVLSRHNIRSPLSGGDSLLGTVTPYEWFNWSSDPSELSLRGGASETLMGQYFHKWMEKEGLIQSNYRPEGEEVRIYANSKQRTIATAEYFSAGLLPTSNIDVEYHMEFDKMDPVFTPQLTFVSDEYKKDAEAQIRQLFDGTIKGLEDNYSLVSDVIDIEKSKAWKDGTVTKLVTDDLTLKLEANAEPGMSGSLKTACSISDALVLQYYEESDDIKAAFGKTLTEKQWKEISEIKDVYGDVLFTAPLVSVNVAHPLLLEIDKELNTEERRFTFLCGHDSNVGSVLAALGVEEYDLPQAIEKKTPIGCKLVFSKWSNASGGKFISVDLVYQSVEQLRDLYMLDLEHSPVVFPITLSGLNKNEDGLYSISDIKGRFDSSISEYDKLISKYGVKAAA
ncbi:MAG: histidine-type phosphatase [Clostridia bacterium]|nr:histidine-type phosphatase [Clostridia bacterium]